MSSPRRIAQVILDTRLPQLDRVFDYELPEGIVAPVGAKVKVPLRSQKSLSSGYVVGLSDSTDHGGKLAAVAEVTTPVPLLSPELWQLAEAIANRQAGSASDVLRLAIPPRYVRVEKKWLEGDEPVEAIAPHQVDLPVVDGYEPEAWSHLLGPQCRSALYQSHGVVALTRGGSVPRATQSVAALAAAALQAGSSLVVVVPTWRDIAHYSNALREVASEDQLSVLQAEGSPSERYGNYLRGLSPRPVIVLGTRHAVFAPAWNLAGIVVVDDADSAHAEPLSPYAHTRDVALLRQQIEGCAVVFASLLPSLSVKRWIDQEYVVALAPSVTHRAQVIPTELSVGMDRDQAPARLPSQAFRAAKEALSQGPVLVQVFRAGYSSGLACASCQERGLCKLCHGPLRIASQGQHPLCTWCGVPDAAWRCSSCSGRELMPSGRGIGRTISEIGKAFPTVPVVRSDGENRVLDVSSKPALVIATRGAEPLAEGGYRAALLLDGAAMLSRESLGALEDSLHAWEQAISLVHSTGVAYLMDVTDAPALAVASGRYEHLLTHELSERSALRLPPAIRLASISGPPHLVAQVRERMGEMFPAVDVLGPVDMGGGSIRIIVRFPYAEGLLVTRELRALRHKLALSYGRNPAERLRMVVDDPDRLDALLGE
ncbi:MAG: primosomal protein N' (replication factor Y) [Pontimonas sp.]